VTAATCPGTLAWTTDALLVALGSGGTLSVLAASLKAWLNQPRHGDVRIEIHDGAGRSMVIDAHRVKDLDRADQRSVQCSLTRRRPGPF
jgi:hypothetical protein